MSTIEFQSLFEVYQLTEASKKQILIDKLKFDEVSAEFFDFNFKGKAVIMANKFIEAIFDLYKHLKNNPQAFYDDIPYYLGPWRQQLVLIRDWIDVGLNGNLGDWQKKGTLNEMVAAAKAWHDSLQTGDNEINYVEENTILRDYRKGGIGFYWVDLETNNSEEESDRMGHCGKTSYGNTIYSLREYKSHGGGHTINISHATAAVGKDDGIIYQLKGPKNTKPKKDLHPYIVDLLMTVKSIRGFGSEYASHDDFSVNDLTVEEVRKIYEARPEIFNNRKSQKALKQLGIVKELPKLKGQIQIDAGELGYYIKEESRYGSSLSIDGIISIYRGYDDLTDEIYENTPDVEYLLKMLDAPNRDKITKAIQTADLLNYSEDIIEKADLTDGFNASIVAELLEEVEEFNTLLYIVRDSYVAAYNDEIYREVVHEVEGQDGLGFYGTVVKTDLVSRSRRNRQGKVETFDEKIIFLDTYDLYALFDEDVIDEVIDEYGNADDDVEGILQNAITHSGHYTTLRIRLDDIAPSKESFNNIIKDELR